MKNDVRDLREARGLSQAALGADLGLLNGSGRDLILAGAILSIFLNRIHTPHGIDTLLIALINSSPTL